MAFPAFFPLSEPRSCFFPRPLDRAIYFVLDIFDHHIMANLKYIHLGKLSYFTNLNLAAIWG